MDLSKIDLNAPAFGPNAQKLDDQQEVVKPVDEAVAEPTTETKIEETSDEESKVPYSRFKKFHDRALEAEQKALQAEREAAEWRARAETYVPQEVKSDSPESWKKLFGDTEESKEAWRIQQQAIEQIKEDARREILEAIKNERFEEVRRTEENVEVLDESFENLSALVGRDLTDNEQSQVLDIIDEFTPKDGDGNYLGALLPIEKAWEIYELKNQMAKAPKAQARDSVASLTSTRTQGEPKVETQTQQTDWSWGSLSRRLKDRGINN